jgi:hypothetical protein
MSYSMQVICPRDTEIGSSPAFFVGGEVRRAHVALGIGRCTRLRLFIFNVINFRCLTVSQHNNIMHNMRERPEERRSRSLLIPSTALGVITHSKVSFAITINIRCKKSRARR